MAFSTDQDIGQRRAAILDLLPDGVETIRAAAEQEMLADVERLWYRQAAASRGIDWRNDPFDVQKIEPADMKRLSILKTLVFVHEFLMKHGAPEADGFERHRAFYEKEYRDELRALVGSGFSYDWDDSGSVDRDETSVVMLRTLVRG